MVEIMFWGMFFACLSVLVMTSFVFLKERGKMKNLRRRVVPLLALLVLLCGVMTVNAFAADDPTEEIGTKMIECPDCGAVGVVLTDEGTAAACDSCGGTGYVESSSRFFNTFWSLLPPIVAIVLALISKEVYSSLFLGCLVGALLYAQFAPWDTIVALVGADYGIVSVLADSGNMGIIVFLVTLGIMVDLMNKGGGSEAFGRWASKTVKTRCAAQLLTMLLGVLIFIDDYFNCLTVGAVMRPVTESHKISRAKLAYLIDATAAPVCMIAPVSSWAAAVSGYVQSDAVNGIEMFIKQIPWNYYCLLTLVMIVVLSVMNIDYGSMLTHEYNAQVKDDLFTTPERPFEGADDYEKPARGRSSVLDLLLPVVVGISYEFIRIAGRSNNWLTRALSCPGLQIQRITTREPDASQIECAIAALKPCIPEDMEDDKW